MLKHRILTALILIPIFLALVIKLSPAGFCILTGLVVLWAGWEWSAFMGISSFKKKFIYPVILLFVLLSSLWLPIPHVFYVAFIWWLLAAVLVIRYPRGAEVWATSVIARGLMGFFVLIPCWLAVNLIRNAHDGVYTLIFLFILIWGADSGAYFVGKKWGKNKLMPAVSPGKTWQGLLGALMTAFIIVVAALAWIKPPYAMWIFVILLSLTTVLFSILGDLFESMLKRNVNLKDSGQLLPGHGGILDRIDSLTAAAPIFALGALLLGRYFQ